MASMREASKRRVTSAYSSMVEPETLAMKRVSEKSSAGRMLRHDVIDARILQPDCVEHARVRLEDAVRRIAEPGVERGALEHDAAGVAIGKAGDTGVFLAETDTAGEQHDRRGEFEPAEIQAQGGF